jgi:hypothetical protein
VAGAAASLLIAQLLSVSSRAVLFAVALRKRRDEGQSAPLPIVEAAV